MEGLEEIVCFVRDYAGCEDIVYNSDIYSHGVVGDDFHELIQEYERRYKVDMSNYLWYFHADEEGQSIGGLFFKPPYRRVVRIPITPKMLFDYSQSRSWDLEYPEREIPNERRDLTINLLIVITVVAFTLWFFVTSYF